MNGWVLARVTATEATVGRGRRARWVGDDDEKHWMKKKKKKKMVYTLSSVASTALAGSASNIINSFDVDRQKGIISGIWRVITRRFVCCVCVFLWMGPVSVEGAAMTGGRGATVGPGETSGAQTFAIVCYERNGGREQ